MKRVTLSVAYPPELIHPLHREVVARDAATRADLLTWGPVGSATGLSWFDADRDATAALLDAVPQMADVSLVAGDGGTYAFTRQTEYGFADELLELVVEADAAFVPPLSFREDRTARFEAVGESDALAAFYEALAGVLDASVEAVHDFRRGGTPADLTTRQRDALAAAVDLGYYEVPREASVADVADAIDCSSSTAGELLRRAERVVVRDAVAGEPAPRRPHRPRLAGGDP
ncbi:helix-turn-helix domain-containing protein [Halobacterium litoreum]|uniref:Helix-turn-helix domain-containing protein n=1 Tax=Halobacterium litoreum TaxID=2039234 RepID=A0ABD5NEP6_9EURY|nr:helix-turn-helix domain-containing protein [Halobacterium litoreum]UHH13280.1 helix-turn-helix domain-containing protein [Halobacterium litoreum]